MKIELPAFNQLKHNELTKTRIKVKRARSIREAAAEAQRGICRALIFACLDRVIFQGGDWIAVNMNPPPPPKINLNA